MPAHSGHIFIKAPEGTFRWEEWDEKDNPRPYVRPGRKQQAKRGRVWTIENVAKKIGDETVFLSPIQVALMALRDAIARDFDAIRVIKKRESRLFLPRTLPRYEDDVTYRVEDLVAKYNPEPVFMPAKNVRGEFDLGPGDGVRNWEISEEGVFHASS